MYKHDVYLKYIHVLFILVTKQGGEGRIRWVFSTKGDFDHQWHGLCIEEHRLGDLMETDSREGYMCFCYGDKQHWVGMQCRNLHA